jgi:DNA polymerase I
MGTRLYSKAIQEAEKHGFTVLYADTDGFYAKYDGDRNKVYEFLKEFNKKLPDPMELELENFYIRGIFVTKREGITGAKKKYAMLDENGRLKIAGFELVRRDFAGIAKKVQEKVLEKILIENDVEGAVNYVREVINKLKNKKIPLEDLVIYTQVTRELSEYESIGPHVYAIKRSGKKVVPGEIIGYVITKGSGSISERAYLVEEMGDREPDPEYYIHHQIIPTVIRILGELGYTEADLLSSTKQEGLEKWMS